MGKLKLVTAKGYSREDALKNSGLADVLDVKFDATVAFKKDGEPTGRQLEGFATEYIEKKVKGAAGIGFAITLETGVADSRERPYKVTNIVTEGARTWKTVYQGFVGADADGLNGTLVLSKDTKGDAEDAAKVYVTENKQKVVIRLGKEVTGSRVKDGDEVKLGAAQAVAMIVDYTPSINTVEGTYVFFGLVSE